MYIYGLCIGMKFDDIANILMSDVGDVFRSLLDADKFSGRDAFNSIDEKLFKYFTKGPYRQLLKYDKRLNKDTSLFDLFKKELADKFKLKSKAVHKLLIDIASDSKIPLSEKLHRIEELRSTYGNIISGYETEPELKESYNQLLDFIEDYICQADVIYKNKNTFNDIFKLATGAKELKTLGQILGLNQGIKTKPDELITQLNNLRHAIYNKTNNLEDIVDLTKFVMDENPYETDGVIYSTYRDYIIDKYEMVKDAFNIFDVVSKVPHYMGYLETLVVTHVEINNAFTFRSSDNLFIPLRERINKGMNQEKLFKGLQNFCGDWLLRHWMLDNQKTITIPAGNMAFDKQGKMYQLTEDKVIHLGLDEDNATFRLWVENKVIPDLQKGLLKPGNPWIKISRNKFIKDLGYNVVNKTVSGNNTVIRALPINMMPSTDNERKLFNEYKSAFNELTDGYQYELHHNIIDNNGQIKSETYLSQPIPITDLITYYAMIANEWKLSQSSLVPITEDFQNMGIIKDFHDYISKIDKSGFTLSMDNIIFNDILPYIAPKESSRTSFSTYIFDKDPKTKIRSLKARYISESGSSYYSKLSNQVDTSTLNFFGAGRVQSGKGQINIKVNDQDIKITYDLINGTYDEISGPNLNSSQIIEELSKIPEFKQVPMIKLNGANIPNIQLLTQAIENITNKC